MLRKRTFCCSFVGLVFMLTGPALPNSPRTQEQTATTRTLSQTEVKNLFKSASTPEDHSALASYRPGATRRRGCEVSARPGGNL